MGLFSGGFLGSGTDESQTTDIDIVTTTTETTENIGDIGLTGANAVELAAVLGTTNVQLADTNVQLADTNVQLANSYNAAGGMFYQEAGNVLSELVGGANALIAAGAAQNSNTLQWTSQFAGEVAQQRDQEYTRLLSTSSSLINPSLDVAQGTQQSMVILAAIAGLVAIFVFRGKK